MRVAVIGAGPSGATLAALLADAGIETTVFDAGQRPALTVGESLVPALVPILRRLGVEEKVARVGIVKPGVSFLWSDEDRLKFSFQSVAHCLPAYAYNAPRDDYDQILIDRARHGGARIVAARASIAASRGRGEHSGQSGAREIAFQQPSADLFPDGRPPDLIVDASGRSRVVGKLLGIPTSGGPRNDAAYFAHFVGCPWLEDQGQVLINRLAYGWSWRIPLRDRLSIGVVVTRDAARAFGSNAEERLHGILASDPELRAQTAAAVRITPVASYSNYQLVTTRGCGPGWVAIGDAFGFVDPMLSPGVFVAQRSAEMLGDRLIEAQRSSSGSAERLTRSVGMACRAFERDMMRFLAAWRELIESFYDGSMIALYRSGREMVAERPGLLTSAMQNHIERQVAAMASGAATTSLYSRTLLRCLRRFGLRGNDPRRFAINGTFEPCASHVAHTA